MNMLFWKYERRSTMFLEVSIILLLMCSAFFSGSETAVMAVDRYQLRTLAGEGSRNAIMLQNYIEDPDRFFGIVLLGNTFTNIAAASLFTLWFVGAVGNEYLMVGTVSLTVAVLIFCEMLPKSIAARHSMNIALFVVKPLRALEIVLHPALYVIRHIVRIISFRKKKSAQALDLNAVRRVIRAASENLSRDDREMLEGILDLSCMCVEDVMMPKYQLDVIDLSQSWDIIQEKLSQKHKNYWLVVGSENWDDFEGVVHMTDIIGLHSKMNHDSLQKAARSIAYVQEGTLLKHQLENFKKGQHEVSVVVDEYGSVVGVLDIHDILEEIVGFYANRTAVPIGSVRFDGGSGYFVKGDLRVRDLNRYLDWKLPETQSVSLAGLALLHLGTIPEGPCSMKINDYYIEVIEIRGNSLILFHIGVR